MAKRSTATSKDSTATIGFQSTALRGSVFLQSQTIPQVASGAKFNFRKGDNHG
jgi:hypothetical protein